MKLYSISIGLFLLFFGIMGAKVIELAPGSEVCEATNCYEQLKQNTELCNNLDPLLFKYDEIAEICTGKVTI